jgi:hypothetical protein
MALAMLGPETAEGNGLVDRRFQDTYKASILETGDNLVRQSTGNRRHCRKRTA